MLADVCRFAQFELDRGAYQLRCKGRPVQLERIPLDLLFILADRRGQLVTREEIVERIWGKGVFLDIDNAINTAVRKIRHALHDDSDSPRFIATVPSKGYRFVAPLHEARGARSLAAQQPDGLQPRSSIVGREREMTCLSAGLHDAIAGHGRLFLIPGEPGVGKTRLSAEVANIAAANRMTVLIGHCSEHAEAVPYLPFVEILESCIDRASSPDTVHKLLHQEGPELARLLPKLRRILPDLPAPLDLPPASARRHLFSCFSDFIGRLSRQGPALLILEDLHWADESTLAMLDHLVHRLSDLPLLIVGTYRDADLDISRGLAKPLEDWLRERLAKTLTLNSLSHDQVAEMLTNLSGKTPPAAVIRKICDETAGNPFFIEELFLHLKEEDRLFDSAGEFRAELKIDEIEAPPSVRLVVGLRLGRLGEPTQKILATAAVIGRAFSFELLEASTHADPGSLLNSVEEAEKAGLFLPSIDTPKARFEFSHELARQAVIAGLSAARRQRLHLEVADAIERTFPSTLEDHYGELAHHYRLGGNLAKAIDYLVRAAEQAASRSGPHEAISMATTGIELLAAVQDDQQHDRHELALQMILGNCARITRGSVVPEVGRAYARALELSNRTDQTRVAIRAMVGLCTFHLKAADYDRMAALHVKLVEFATAGGDSRLRGMIHHTVGFGLLYHGDFEAARHQLEQALRLSAGRRLHVQACAAMALAMWNLGYPVRASKLIGKAAAEGRALPDSYAEVMAADFVCMAHAMSKDVAAAKVYAETITNISTEYGFAGEIASASIVHAWADGCGGDPRGIDQLREKQAAFEAIEGQGSRSFVCGLIAELCLKFGRNDEAAAALEDAIAFIARTGEEFAQSEIYRLRAEVELRLGRSHLASAANWFERAIDAARKRSAKIAELRATAGLARMLAKQGNRKRARKMLSDIYNWFTEGFDTADLKDAKALLDDLSV